MPKSGNKKTTNKVSIYETKLGRKNSLGLWDKKTKNHSVIYIDERLKGFQKLMILLHESLHETCEEWAEEKVVETSEILATILWKCNYRQVDIGNENAKPSYQYSTDKKKTSKVEASYELRRNTKRSGN